MDEEGLSRKEKLALWRAKKGMGAGAKYSKVDKSAETGKGSQNHGGVLAARPDAGNVAKKPASRPAKRNTQRKPFQVSHGHQHSHGRSQGSRVTLLAPLVQATATRRWLLAFIVNCCATTTSPRTLSPLTCWPTRCITFPRAKKVLPLCNCCSCCSRVQANCSQYESHCSKWET